MHHQRIKKGNQLRQIAHVAKVLLTVCLLASTGAFADPNCGGDGQPACPEPPPPPPPPPPPEPPQKIEPITVTPPPVPVIPSCAELGTCDNGYLPPPPSDPIPSVEEQQRQQRCVQHASVNNTFRCFEKSYLPPPTHTSSMQNPGYNSFPHWVTPVHSFANSLWGSMDPGAVKNFNESLAGAIARCPPAGSAQTQCIADVSSFFGQVGTFTIPGSISINIGVASFEASLSEVLNYISNKVSQSSFTGSQAYAMLYKYVGGQECARARQAADSDRCPLVR